MVLSNDHFAFAWGLMPDNLWGILITLIPIFLAVKRWSLEKGARPQSEPPNTSDKSVKSEGKGDYGVGYMPV